MKPAVVAKLLEINRQFYAEHARDFADTRERLQPGVKRIQESLRSEDSVLDLGCGSGRFASALSQGGHRGRYLGVDFSAALLDRARLGRYDFPAAFVQADLTAPEQLEAASLAVEGKNGIENSNDLTNSWDVVTAFAVLHHLPGREPRVALLELVRRWLRPAGSFIHSNWRFTSNARMRERILPWSSVDLNETDVDDGDYLVDWRRGQSGVRYVHEFSEAELTDLARETGFRSVESFASDGVDRHSGWYEIWTPC